MSSDISKVSARGVALTVDSTFGSATLSDVGPTSGPPFDIERSIDVLAALGADAARLTVDWARVQPHPTRVDTEWIERYDQVFELLDTAGVDAWCTALDAAVPRWFDNEGGLGDQAALTKWWPRWFEVVAERWGDRVRGWIPFDVVPDTATRAWRDTRGILRGGDAPVAYAIDVAQHDLRSLDVVAEPQRPDADAFAVAGTWGTDGREHELLLAIADETDLPVAIGRARLDPPLADAAASFRQVVDQLTDDVPTVAWFADPLWSDDDEALLDSDGHPTDAARITFASS